MKRLTCEMCGSTDLVKQDGVFVCQSCGCKYSIEEAKKMMIEGTVEVTGTVKVDNTDKLETYKEIASNAYDAGNTDEAYQYYLKVLEIDPKDWQAIFYKGMCQGWKSTLAKPRVDEAIMGYQQACEFVPNEILDKVKPLFIGELVGLISAWFDKAQQRYYDVQDWYSSNIDIFWDYLGVAEKVIRYLDLFKSIVLNSESTDLLKKYGELYCNACYAMCVHVVEWKSYSNKDDAYFPGFSRKEKQPFLDKYDDMVYEIRKYIPDFKKLEVGKSIVWGCINRGELPTSIGRHNQVLSDLNQKECLRIDKETDERVRAWKTEKERKEKEERAKVYWAAHPTENAERLRLKSLYDESEANFENAKKAKSEAEDAVYRVEKNIKEINEEIDKKLAQIAKLKKKIFGKAKAQEEIHQLEQEIATYQNARKDAEPCLESAKATSDEAFRKFNIANIAMRDAKSEYNVFLKKCEL